MISPAFYAYSSQEQQKSKFNQIVCHKDIIVVLRRCLCSIMWKLKDKLLAGTTRTCNIASFSFVLACYGRTSLSFPGYPVKKMYVSIIIGYYEPSFGMSELTSHWKEKKS